MVLFQFEKLQQQFAQGASLQLNWVFNGLTESRDVTPNGLLSHYQIGAVIVHSPECKGSSILRNRIAKRLDASELRSGKSNADLLFSVQFASAVRYC